MSERGFVTKGTPEYFAERERRMQVHIDEAKSKIDEIETKVMTEIAEINAQRDRLHQHLSSFIDARNELAGHRNKTTDLVAQLQAIVSICDAELPTLDAMLDELETDTIAADAKLAAAEHGKQRQLNKHVRKKTRYEMRKSRLQLRQKIATMIDSGADLADAVSVAMTGDDVATSIAQAALDEMKGA